MPHPLWKGHVSFGLVSIPVVLFPGDASDDLSFELLDDRDLASIGYRKINKNTGHEVPREHVVRGYRLEDGRVVTVTDEDLKNASPGRTRTIELACFVDLGQIPPAYFDRPYRLRPDKNGEKGYAILREAMRKARKAAVGTVVLRAREHLGLLFVEGPWLVFNTLRYRSELRDPQDEGRSPDTEDLGIQDREIALAGRLIEEMVEPWKPEQYQDRYREELLAAIRQKAQSGEARAAPAEAPAPGERPGKVHDMMTLLRKSVTRAAERRGKHGKTG